jgi:hypothetical protein
MEPVYKEYFKEGYLASQESIKLADNPYEDGTVGTPNEQYAWYWDMGWYSAQEDS